ncbi:MAG: extracellular solute-binding protein [Bdellovibrionales bacterium]
MHGAPKYGPQDTHVEYADPNAPKGGSLKTAAIGTFDTINPYAIKGKAALGLNLVYDRLMARVWDEPFTMYPLIAERYDMPEDRSSITFTLNPKARFHDDAPITADDIIFSFETLRDFGRPNMRRVYKLVKSVTKQEDGSIRFDFGDGYDRETALIIAMMPVLSKASWQGQDFDSTTLDKKNLNGPYRIKNIDAGRSITYQRIPDYWAKDLLPNKGHYNFDEITYDYYRDDNVAFEAFAAGDLTLRREGDSAKWDTIYDFPAVQSGETVKTAFDHGRPQPARGFIFNTRRPPFDDINVRHALSLVLDRNAINALLYNGEKRLIKSYFPNSPFSSMHPDDNQDLGDQQTDPDFRQDAREQMRHAATLLKQSGWAIENGQQTKNDKTLSFELLLQTPEDEKLALHYAQSLKRLGIDLRIRVTDSADFLRRLNAYDFDMVLHDWQSSLSPGTEQLLYWGCAAATQPGRFNYAGICDPDIDAAATSVADTKTRVELVETMRKLDAKLLAGYYMVPLFYNAQDYIAYDRHIHAPQTTPLYGPVLETWWMERN